LHDIIMLLS